MSQHPRIFSLTALCAATVLALSAYGGGSDDPAPAPTPAPAPSPAPAPAPEPGSVTLKGQVAVDGPLQGVQVSLDLNGNGTCDANEPTSAATGAEVPAAGVDSFAPPVCAWSDSAQKATVNKDELTLSRCMDITRNESLQWDRAWRPAPRDKYRTAVR